MRPPVANGTTSSRCSRRSAPSSSSATRLRRCGTGCRGFHPRRGDLSAPRLLARLGAGTHGSLGQARASLRVAEEMWTANGDRMGEALVLLWHAARYLWDLNNRRAVDYAQRALDNLPADRPAERILALMTLGIGHLHHGEPQAAEAAFSDVRTLIDTSGAPGCDRSK